MFALADVKTHTPPQYVSPIEDRQQSSGVTAGAAALVGVAVGAALRCFGDGKSWVSRENNRTKGRYEIQGFPEGLYQRCYQRSAAAPCPAILEPAPNAVGMLYDSTLCVGCKACVSRCKEVNGMPAVIEGDWYSWDSARTSLPTHST